MSQNTATPFERAFALHQQGRLAESLELYRGLLAKDPDNAELLHLTGLVLHQMGHHEASVPLLTQAAVTVPNHAGYLYNLGVVLQRLNRKDEAEDAYRRTISLEPGHLSAWINLGNLLCNAGRFNESAECHRNSLRLEPGNAESHTRLARSLRMMGDIENALAHLGVAVSLDPENSQTASELLFTSQYEPGITLEELARRHYQWAARLPAAPRPPAAPRRSLEPPFRVGFLSPDLGNHPVGIFMAPLLERLRKHPDIITICFSDREVDDEFTVRNRQAANEWHEVHGVPDKLLSDRIRQASLDVLIELTGHTEQNRLPLMATKPAPIQISWAGYVGTTGLESIDYLITDPFHSPDGSEAHYFETLLRFPNDYIPYEPPSYAPGPGPLPLLSNGYVTFGCLNNPAKLTDATLKLWARILRAIPDSRLILKYKGMDDTSVQHRVLGLLAAHGVESERIELIGQTNHGEHLATFRRVDIALDPTPYSGGLSTCEAIWMGVPVITCPGETFASRHSLSHLSNAGLDRYVARDFRDYIDKAISLAADPTALSRQREEMRDQVAASPLCDLDAYAEDFVAAIRVVMGQHE